jgi:hypothetical protein
MSTSVRTHANYEQADNCELTIGDVIEVSGMARQTLGKWVDLGVFGPGCKGAGLGTYRQFGFTEALAATVGARFMRAGFDPLVARQAAETVMSLGTERLIAAIAGNRRYLVHLDGKWQMARLRLSDPTAARLLAYCHVGEALAEVRRKIAEIAARPVRPGPGRRRGLAKYTA